MIRLISLSIVRGVEPEDIPINMSIRDTLNVFDGYTKVASIYDSGAMVTSDVVLLPGEDPNTPKADYLDLRDKLRWVIGQYYHDEGIIHNKTTRRGKINNHPDADVLAGLISVYINGYWR